jgi:hypothetical protein
MILAGEGPNDRPHECALVCERCGKTGPDVKETICPYDKEINDTETPATLCDDCYQESVDDI